MPPERMYSNEQIKSMLQKCKEERGKVSPRMFSDYDEFCSPALVMRRFGGWTAAKEAAGIKEDLSSETGRRKQYTDEELLSHLREVQRKHGKCTPELLQQENELCAKSVVMNRFGGWKEAKRLAGLKPDARQSNSRPREYTDEDYLELIRECYEKHGKVTQQLFDEDDDFPTEGAIRGRFGDEGSDVGGWRRACEMAGVPVNAGGGSSKYSDEELLEMLRECKEKHGKCSFRVFSSDDRFCSAQTVQQRFGSWSEAKEQAGLK